MLKKLMKNERGLTLIELLAVVVILGIIAAIAIPAIGGMINNSKEDAHIANAKQIANAARLYVTTSTENANFPSTKEIKLSELITAGHIEDIKDPSGNGTYDTDKTKVSVEKVGNNYKYYVILYGTKEYTDQINATEGVTRVEAEKLTRTEITL